MILTQIVTAIITGILATIMTIVLTPTLQHYFWKLQRLAELRFTTAKEFNRLMGEYLAGHIARDTGADPSWKPSREFFASLHATAMDLGSLFSRKALDAFDNVEALLTAEGGLGPPGDSKIDQDFIEASNKAMRAFYEEIGLRLPKTTP